MRYVFLLIVLLIANNVYPSTDPIPSLNCQPYSFVKHLKNHGNQIERDYMLRIINHRKKIDLLCSFVSLDKLKTISESIDPNFVKNKSYNFSGILIEEIIQSLDIKEENMMFLTKDNYIFHDKTKSVVENGGLIAIYSKGEIIPNRFGGPIKLVYDKIRDISAYPWYIRTIIFGKGFSKKLVLSLEDGRIDRLDKNELLRLVNLPKVDITLNRGYDPNTKITKHVNLNILSLRRLLSNEKYINYNKFTFFSFGGQTKTVDVNDTKELYFAIYNLEDGYFPVTGGQYILVQIINKQVYPFIYYLEGVQIERQ